MQAQFWHERWAGNQIGFHENAVNPLLVTHFPALGLVPPARVLLPLCGKTLDIDWLLALGYRVVGVELSSIAVEALFSRLQQVPVVERASGLECWSVPGLTVFVGDIFELSSAAMGRVDAVYDRAALIALPPPMRQRYAAHLRSLAPRTPQLLVTLDYDQACLAGPPFAVGTDEVRALYADRIPQQLAAHPVPGGLKGRCPASENVWLLPAAGVAVTPGSAQDPAAAASAR